MNTQMTSMDELRRLNRIGKLSDIDLENIRRSRSGKIISSDIPWDDKNPHPQRYALSKPFHYSGSW